jgi:hypothetical protein
MSKCIITLFSALPLFVLGQSTSFGPANAVVIVQNELKNPLDVSAADLDGDGDKDVLTISTINDKVVWYENLDGLGSFGSQKLISGQADGVQSVIAIDMDNDGDMDVVTASYEDHKIAWYENTDGAGTFSTQKIISTSMIHAWDLEAADFDGDGDIDVAAISYDDKASWFENLNGLGNFSSEIIIDVIGDPVKMAIGDVDGDGDTDILTGSFSTGIILLRNNGNGDFGIADQILTEQVTSFNLYDLDSDGDLDITASFYGSFSNSKSFWVENTNGFDNIGSVEIFNFDVGTWAASPSIIPFDIDNDGDRDVLASTFGIGWCEFENGEFCELGGFQFLDTDNSEYFILEDINSDGRLDILSAGEGNVTWYKNETTGQSVSFGPRQIISAYIPYDVYSFSSGDIDGDGYTDVVTTSPLDNFVSWHKNDGMGNFEKQDTLPLNFQNVYTADFDNDGDLDLLLDRFTDGMAWYGNNSVMFSLAQDFIMGETIESALPRDFDLDGDTDIVVHLNSENILWYENLDGLGNFSGQMNLIEDAGSHISFVNIADVDGDNDLDIPVVFIGAGSSADTVAWFENIDGTATTWEKNIFHIGGTLFEDRMVDLELADINGDGNLDFIVGHSEKIIWFQSIGGSLISQTLIDINMRTPNIEFKDLDNDGDLDMLAADVYGTYWYENEDGQGIFGNKNQIATHSLRDNLTAEDVDNDGDLDIIGNFLLMDNVFWHENFLIGPSIIEPAKLDQSNVRLTAFPNPFVNDCYVVVNELPEACQAKLTISLLNGSVLKEVELNIAGMTVVDFRGLLSGPYFIQLIDSNSGDILTNEIIIKQ